MRGFKPGCKKFADGGVTGQGFGFPARGGPIRGPGTGTSDSIKAAVPEGSFIMPADSTAQIGEANLAGLGFQGGRGDGAGQPAVDVPALGFKPRMQVNLSKGEYQLPPEQVHALGVQVLNQIKDATHTPVALQQPQGFQPKKSRANPSDLSFADGGVALRASNPGSLLPSERDVPTPKSLGDLFNEMTPSGRADNALAKSREGLDTSGETSMSSPPAAAESTGAPATAPAPAAASPQSSLAPTAPAVGASPSTPALPGGFQSRDVGGGITKVTGGSSPLYTNIDPGQAVAQMKGFGAAKPWLPTGSQAGTAPTPATPYGPAPDLAAPASSLPPGIAQGAPGVNTFNMRADNEARARENAIRATMLGDGPKITHGTDTAAIERERDAIMSAALAPGRGFGGRRGGGAASQLGVALALHQAPDQNEAARYAIDKSVETAAMRDAGDTRRAQMRESGDAARAAATNALHRDEFNLRRETQGFQNLAAKRQEDLYRKYEAAESPEERATIAQQIRDLAGKQEPTNKFTVVPGGQEIDPTTNQLVTRPARVLNNQSGQFVDPQNSNQAFEKGKVYSDAKGNKARWDGGQFVPV